MNFVRYEDNPEKMMENVTKSSEDSKVEDIKKSN